MVRGSLAIGGELVVLSLLEESLSWRILHESGTMLEKKQVSSR